MKKGMILFFVFVSFWISPSVFAQTHKPIGVEGKALTALLLEGATQAPVINKKEKLQVLLQERLEQSLGLSPDQAKKFSEIMRKYHQKRRELREQMKTYRGQLEAASNSTDASQATQLVANLQKTRDEIEKLEDAQFKEIKPMLNPQQQAKYFLIMEQIHRELMQIKRGNPPPKANF